MALDFQASASELTPHLDALLAAGETPTRKDWSHYLRESLGLTKSRAEAYAACFVRAGLIEDAPTGSDALSAAKALLDRVARLATDADA